jgi:hypothetical protein
VEDHIRDVSTYADGTMREPQDVVCWGAMLVGSEIWVDYHVKGIHPMTYVVAMVVKEVCNEEGIGRSNQRPDDEQQQGH